MYGILNNTHATSDHDIEAERPTSAGNPNPHSQDKESAAYTMGLQMLVDPLYLNRQLFQAIDDNHAGRSLMLCWDGADPENMFPGDYYSPFLYACYRGVNAILFKTLLLHITASAKKITLDNGNSAVHLTAQRKHHHMLEALLDAGFPANKQNVYGLTPLMFAVENLQEKAVALLLESCQTQESRALMVNTKDIHRQTALSRAREYKRNEILEPEQNEKAVRIYKMLKAAVPKAAPTVRRLRK